MCVFAINISRGCVLLIYREGACCHLVVGAEGVAPTGVSLVNVRLRSEGERVGLLLLLLLLLLLPLLVLLLLLSVVVVVVVVVVVFLLLPLLSMMLSDIFPSTDCPLTDESFLPSSLRSWSPSRGTSRSPSLSLFDDHPSLSE